jgi:eukaryotic-like serine/threonine-protein kinase
MALTVGTQLGPYEILDPIGAGGIGKAWKARDTRPGRIVAIKFRRTGAARAVEMTMSL